MAKSERIVSVDFLRGLTVAGMILVNNPGSWEYIYAPLRHAGWHGCTPTDFIFPFFIFIVGVSVAYSLATIKNQPAQHGAAIRKIVKRSALLFLFGLILNFLTTFDWETLRIPGVLQRISIVFLVSALLYLKTNIRTQIVLVFVLLVGYWLLLTQIPVPGIGPANLEPGTNLAAWVDSQVLCGHVWAVTQTWDPEGLLSTLPAIASALIGVVAGTCLRRSAKPQNTIVAMAMAGIILVAGAWLWNSTFPINKSLWTSSFVLYTSGVALLVLALCYWLMDIKGYKTGIRPFLAFGANAMTAYMLSEIVAIVLYSVSISGNTLKHLQFQALSFPEVNPQLVSFVLAIIWVVLIWVPINWMYRKKIFLKV
jgi:predicted acyltransferase